MKELGLAWRPHVGCFVWDPEGHIASESPFPNRVYFILSLPRFVDIFGSVEQIVQKLVWLPTWHQARLLCQHMNIVDEQGNLFPLEPGRAPADEYIHIYKQIISAMMNG